MTTRFETKTCSRCAGSGSYSFNQIDGSRCYGCGGSGLQLTKRGAVARAHFYATTRVAIEDVRPGWIIWDEAFLGRRAKWMPVVEAGPSETRSSVDGGATWIAHLMVRTARGSYSAPAGSMVRAAPDAATINALLDAAVAFQATLTATGKPARRSAAAAAVAA
jgi:hypothetical protein